MSIVKKSVPLRLSCYTCCKRSLFNRLSYSLTVFIQPPGYATFDGYHMIQKCPTYHEYILQDLESNKKNTQLIECKVDRKWGNLRSSTRVIIPASSFLQAHESSQQKVPTTIAYTQLTKAPALFHYHKNAVCNGGEKLLGIHRRRRIEPRAFIFSITCRLHLSQNLVTCLDTFCA